MYTYIFARSLPRHSLLCKLALKEDINFNLQHLQRHLGQQQILLLGGLNDGSENLGSYQKQAGVVELQTLQIDYEIY